MKNSLRQTLILLTILLSFVGMIHARELTFWNFWDPRLIGPVIERFEKENPGVKIISEQIPWGNGFDKIVVALANGRAPDICELGSTWMGRFINEKAVLELTLELQDLKSDYLMWEPVTDQGKIYGMPWLVGTRVLFYNRRLFAEAGLNPEQPPQTWAELLSAAQKIHQPAAGRYGFGMNAGEAHILYKKFMPLVWANGGRIIADDGSWAFNSRETRQALEFYLQLKNFSYCEKQDLLDEAFKKGTLGMMVSGAWNFASFPKDAPELDFSVALMPRPAENKGVEASFLGGQVLVLLKNCREPELAARFIRFLARAENSLPISREALVNFPAARSSYTDSLFTGDPRLQVFVEQMKTAVHPPVHRYWMEIEKILNQGIEKAMYGQNIDQVLAETSQAFEKLDGGKTQAIRQADVQAMPVGNGSWQTILLVLIALGTLLNAILLTFLLVEVKKNAA